MSRRTRALGMVAAVALAAGSLGVSVPAAAAGGTMTTCTITTIGVVPAPQGVAINELGTGYQNCVGAFIFLGVNASALGYPKPTVNDFAELAAVLHQWVPADGVPGVGQWVNLSPAVASGMKAAGINPITFLQWLNGNDGGAPWPSFVPKPACLALVGGVVPSSGTGCVTPLAVVGAAPSKTAQQAATSATQPVATDGVAHTTATKPAPPPVAKPSTPPASSVSAASVAAHASSTAVGTPVAVTGAVSGTGSAPRKPAPPSPAAQPPVSTTIGGVTVPCAIQASCAAQLDRHIRYETGWWGRFKAWVAGIVQSVPGWVTRDAILVAAASCALTFSIRYWIHRRRNWYWY